MSVLLLFFAGFMFGVSAMCFVNAWQAYPLPTWRPHRRDIFTRPRRGLP